MDNDDLKVRGRKKKVEDARIYEEPVKKSSGGGGVIAGILVFVFAFLIVVAGCGILIWGVKTGKFDRFVNKFKSITQEKEVVEIRHTETTTVKTEGVYITDVSEVVEEVMPSIVSITSKTVINSGIYAFFGGGSYTATGAGSGIIISEDNDYIYVLTNYHVVEDTTELSVTFIDDESVDATIKGTSERKDIAVVTVKKSDVKAETLNKIKIATIGSSDELKVGNGVIAIGNALGYGQSVTTGVVSALHREIVGDSNGQEMIQMDAPINGGNSGGALLNAKGEVVGINSAKYSSKATSSGASIEGMCFAIPISDVEDLIKELMNGTEDKGVLLGIEGYMTTASGNTNVPEGFYVATIDEGSNADNSDLEVGDIITHIDGQKVTSNK